MKEVKGNSTQHSERRVDNALDLRSMDESCSKMFKTHVFFFLTLYFLNPVGRGWNIELPFANFYLESCVPHCPMGQVVIKFQSASLGSPTPLNFLHSGTFPTYPPAVEHGHGKVIYKWLYLQRKVILHSKLLKDQRIPALVEPHLVLPTSASLVAASWCYATSRWPLERSWLRWGSWSMVKVIQIILWGAQLGMNPGFFFTMTHQDIRNI